MNTFGGAQLANADGQTRVDTELYDSGASRHMSPRQHDFLNFVPIIPKMITAADKGTFKAIGQDNMLIDVPNGDKYSKVLLRDVLYALSMGVTLISISKITAMGCSVLFRKQYCRIFGRTRRTLGVVPMVNGLYRFDHKILERGASAEEKVTIDVLHRRLGHIALKPHVN
jgi:hypothetical protein